MPPTFEDALTSGVKLNISGSFPGENLLVALLDYAKERRQTMDPALQKRLDAILVQQMEDAQSVWRQIMITLGVVKI